MPPPSRIFFAVCGPAVRPSPRGFPERGHLHVETKDINIVVRYFFFAKMAKQTFLMC